MTSEPSAESFQFVKPPFERFGIRRLFQTLALNLVRLGLIAYGQVIISQSGIRRCIVWLKLVGTPERLYGVKRLVHLQQSPSFEIGEFGIENELRTGTRLHVFKTVESLSQVEAAFFSISEGALSQIPMQMAVTVMMYVVIFGPQYRRPFLGFRRHDACAGRTSYCRTIRRQQTHFQIGGMKIAHAMRRSTQQAHREPYSNNSKVRFTFHQSPAANRS